MEFPFSVAQALLAVVATILGTVIQSAVGFGLGPLSVPLLILIDPVFVPGPVLINALVLALLMFRKEMGEADYFCIRWGITGRFIGTVIGAALLAYLPKEFLKLAFGILILAAVSFNWMGISLPVQRRALITTGIFSGFMGTTVSIGGPPMALIFQNMSGPKVRSTLSAIFGAGTIMGIVSLTFIGFFGLKEWYASLIIFPGILIGYHISKYLGNWLDRGLIKPAILILSSFTAMIVIVSYFM
jgi:hypothetical protein